MGGPGKFQFIRVHKLACMTGCQKHDSCLDALKTGGLREMRNFQGQELCRPSVNGLPFPEIRVVSWKFLHSNPVEFSGSPGR